MNKGKRYAEAVKGYDRDHLYSPVEAVDLVKSLAKARFDETVELATRLGVDPRRVDRNCPRLTLAAGGHGAGCTRRCLRCWRAGCRGTCCRR